MTITHRDRGPQARRTESCDQPSLLTSSSPASIADQYADLLGLLTPNRRAGLIARLTTGYYEGWRPSRSELADLIASEVGVLTWEQADRRHRQRLSGREPDSITPALRAWRRALATRRAGLPELGQRDRIGR